MSLLKESINEFVRLSGIEESEGMNENNLFKIWKENMYRVPAIETANGVIFLQPSDDGKHIEYGTATNTGLIVEGSAEYDFDMSFDWNLEAVVDQIYEENGYPNKGMDEGSESPLNEADSSSDDYDKTAPIRIYVGTYGKYNNGSLHGKWISLPKSEEELKKELAYVAQGENDPEFMIQDYETDIPGLRISEYSSINDLNEKASMVGEIMDDEASRNALEAYLDKGYSFEEAIEAVNEGDWSYERADSETDLAYAIIDSLGGFENTLSKEQMDYYFDFEALGRDLRIEGAYNDEETGEEPDWIAEMSDEELGEQYADDVGMDGIANKEYYFDYERYGRDLAMDDYWKTTDGYVWCG